MSGFGRDVESRQECSLINHTGHFFVVCVLSKKKKKEKNFGERGEGKGNGIRPRWMIGT